MRTIVIVDNVDPDNGVAALAACASSLKLNVAAVIVTGRYRPHGSEETLQLNTRRMKGLLVRNGYEQAPVFAGSTPPRAPVPDDAHIDERLLDIYWDERHTAHDGSLQDALDLVAAMTGELRVVAGGPLTDVAHMMADRRLRERLGFVTAQLGMFGWANVRAMAGGRRQFNAVCDPSAARAVLEGWPAPVALIPTDITKASAFAYAHPDELVRLRLPGEVIAQYAVFWSRALIPRDEMIYVHDAHPVVLAAQVGRVFYNQADYWGAITEKWSNEHSTVMTCPYTLQSVQVSVDDDGVVDAKYVTAEPTHYARYAVTSALAEPVHRILTRAISERC